MDLHQIEDRVKLETSWKKPLLAEFQQPYMLELRRFLQAEIQSGKTIYPKSADIFAALNLTPLNQVRVVIVGQDPYHGPGQAHGLCFSVQPGTPAPPSLVNIYKELASDLNIPRASHGHLISWAKQGVLLLNSVLTVEQAKPGSHQNRGWEKFTDRIIHVINETQENIVFVLWGSYAQKKAHFVDRKKHFVVECVHPSPLSAHRGFMGSKPFSKINAYLKENGLEEINWKLP